jgi:hypothetical protein
MGTPAYELSEDAALTLLLHASKHPSCTVSGALFGRQRGGGGGYEIVAAAPLFHRSHVMAPCVEAALTQARTARAAGTGGSQTRARTWVGSQRRRSLAAACSVGCRLRRARLESPRHALPPAERRPGPPCRRRRRRRREQAEAAAQQQGLTLAGWYHADYKPSPPGAAAELGPHARRVADRIAERSPGACALVLENSRLAAFTGAAAAAAAAESGGGGSGGGGDPPPPLELLLRDPSASASGGGGGAKGGGGGSGAWRRPAPGGPGGLSAGGGGWGAVRKRYLNLFAAGRHRAVFDFDDHLDDVSRDWLNAGLLDGSALLAR